MDFLLSIGLLLIVGFTVGWLLDKIGLPKILGYVITGIVFSPNTFHIIDQSVVQATEPLLQVCLSFITFEVGGALKWSKIKRHRKEILSITLFESLTPAILVVLGVYMTGILFPGILPVSSLQLFLLALLLGSLASPTDPATTIAVMHQYKARGKVSDTIMGVAALDDVVGILLFSLTMGVISIFSGSQHESIGIIALRPLYHIAGAIGIGTVLALAVDPLAKLFRIKSEGQWIIIIFSLIILSLGISKTLHVDELLACMTMGAVIVNRSKHEAKIFKIIVRYTEDLIFLFFFLLSGMHLNISTIPQSAVLILIFVALRTSGKFFGAYTGARIAKADPVVRKYTAGGLIPQGGIVIGLMLSFYQKGEFGEISEILLTTVMGATIIHELLGPFGAKYALKKAGEIKVF